MKSITQTRLGILGGGQLGRMLIQEAINFNLSISILDPDAQAPCKNICDYFEVGSLSDYKTVYNFGKNLDVLTIEIEKVNIEALEDLEKAGVTIYPQARIIRLIQDKGLQKQFFKENGIPTSEFQLIANKEQLINASITFPFIQKLRKDGYDGKGVVKIVDQSDYAKAFEAPSIVEKWINFEKEISVIVARNKSGQVETFPVVEMDFNAEANLVEFLISPSTYDFEIQQKADLLARKIAESLNIVGLLAVEMFLTANHEIMVNELAPRPHNSGHQTIEGNVTSQFQQHLRAILNLPLGSTKSTSNAIMINLLGESGYEGPASYEGLNDVLKKEGVYVHLYGKAFTKPFRKMGHVTIIDNDRNAALEKAQFVKDTLKVKA